MGFLHLNSNVDVFPELGSYQQLLFDQSAGHGLPPVGPGRGRPVPRRRPQPVSEHRRPRRFGVLKNKWRILFHLPSYPQQKQSKIIVACIALHNFIRQSQLPDIVFDKCDQDENYVPLPMPTTTTNDSTNEMDSAAMNQFRAWVADGLWSLKQQ